MSRSHILRALDQGRSTNRGTELHSERESKLKREGKGYEGTLIPALSAAPRASPHLAKRPAFSTWSCDYPLPVLLARILTLPPSPEEARPRACSHCPIVIQFLIIIPSLIVSFDPFVETSGWALCISICQMKFFDLMGCILEIGGWIVLWIFFSGGPANTIIQVSIGCFRSKNLLYFVLDYIRQDIDLGGIFQSLPG